MDIETFKRKFLEIAKKNKTNEEKKVLFSALLKKFITPRKYYFRRPEVHRDTLTSKYGGVSHRYK